MSALYKRQLTKTENIGSHRLFPNSMGVSLMVPDPKASEFNSRQADR